MAPSFRTLLRLYMDVTTDDKGWVVLTGKAKEVVEHVQNERTRRGWRSVREAADHSDISNETWSKFERDGRVTKGVRDAVQQAFGWPENWPEELPELSPWKATDKMLEMDRRLADLEGLVAELRKRPPAPPGSDR